MPISRPLLIVLIAAIVGLGAFYATQGSRQAADAPAPATPEPAADPAPKPQSDASKPVDAAKPARADKAKADAAQQPLQVAKAERKSARKAAAVSGPAAVRRAVGGDKTVVLYFYGPESADDSATGRAVAGLSGMREVAVFKVPIRRLNAYRDLVGQLGIAQAPAVVIVGRGRSARVIEGYVDPPTLRQDVADAR
jgi:chemotaxis protein histidine kinase CheA